MTRVNVIQMTGDFWDECMLVQARDEATGEGGNR